MSGARITMSADFAELVKEAKEAEQALEQLANQHGISKRKAKEHMRALERNAKALEKEADANKKAAAANSEEARALREVAAAEEDLAKRKRASLDGTRKAAEALQGPLGGTISRLVSAGEAAGSLTSALGPVGLVGAASLGALAASAVGIASVTTAMAGLVQRADELLENSERLHAVAPIIPISQEDADKVRDVSDALDTLSAVFDAGLVKAAAGAAETLEPVVKTVIMLGLAANDLSEFLDVSGSALDRWGGKVARSGSTLAGLHETMSYFYGEEADAVIASVKRTTEAEENRTAGLAASKTGQDAVNRTIKLGSDQLREYTAAQKKLELEEDRVAGKRAQHAKNREAAADRMQARVDGALTGESALRAAHSRRLEAIKNDLELTKDVHAAEMARGASAIQLERGLAKLAEDRSRRAQQVADKAQRAADKEHRANEQRVAQRRAWHAERQAEQEQEQQAQRRTTESIAGSFMDLGSAASKMARVRADSLERGSAAHKQAALEAFRIEQATSAAQAAVHGGLAITRSVAELGPIAGPIAGVAMGALVAAEIAGILAQSPPAAHLGSRGQIGRSGPNAPDEQLMRVRKNETVQTAQQSQAAQQAPVFIQQFSHKFFNSTSQEQLRRDGVLTRAIDGEKAPGVSYGV